MRVPAWLLLAVALAAVHACAGRELLDGDVSAAIRNFNKNTQNAKKGAYPWVVGLYFNSKTPSPIGLKYGQLFCQGALITPEVVLTAASCFYTNDMSLVAGRIWPFVKVGAYSSNGLDPKNGIFANVTVYAYNKRYNFGDHLPSWDIALLLLDRNITGVKPIKMSKFARVDPLRGGISWTNSTMLSTIGWGPTQGPAGDWEGDYMAKTLQWTNTLKATPQQCKEQWPDYNWESGRLMCTRYYGHGKNSCYKVGLPGDGGAPVFLEPKTGAPTLVAVTNKGRCNRLKPTVLQSVAHFRPWIEEGIYLMHHPEKFTGDQPYWAYVKSQGLPGQ